MKSSTVGGGGSAASVVVTGWSAAAAAKGVGVGVVDGVVHLGAAPLLHAAAACRVVAAATGVAAAPAAAMDGGRPPHTPPPAVGMAWQGDGCRSGKKPSIVRGTRRLQADRGRRRRCADGGTRSGSAEGDRSNKTPGASAETGLLEGPCAAAAAGRWRDGGGIDALISPRSERRVVETRRGRASHLRSRPRRLRNAVLTAPQPRASRRSTMRNASAARGAPRGTASGRGTSREMGRGERDMPSGGGRDGSGSRALLAGWRSGDTSTTSSSGVAAAAAEGAPPPPHGQQAQLALRPLRRDSTTPWPLAPFLRIVRSRPQVRGRLADPAEAPS